jgi:hypothetical protein
MVSAVCNRNKFLNESIFKCQAADTNYRLTEESDREEEDTANHITELNSIDGPIKGLNLPNI